MDDALIQQLSTDGCGPIPDREGYGGDSCRDWHGNDPDEIQRLYFGLGWFKATHTSYNPEAFAHVLVELLSAQSIPAPYQEPYANETCGIDVRWVYVNMTQPDGSPANYMFHIVRQHSTTVGGGEIDVHNFSAHVLESRNLRDDVFDTWLYNSLVFQVADLGPFKSKLSAMGEPFLERLIPAAGGEASCAIWTSLPGTSYALSLIAPMGCDKTTTATFDACAAS